MGLKKWKLFTSKSVGTGTSSYEKRIYRAAVSQRLRNTALTSFPPQPIAQGHLQTSMYVCKSRSSPNDINYDIFASHCHELLSSGMCGQGVQ